MHTADHMVIARSCQLPALAAGLALAACGVDPGREAAGTVVATRAVGDVDQPASIRGRDGGDSGMAFGHAIYAYGDTVLTAPDQDGETWHHNSFAFTDDHDGSDGLGPMQQRSDAAGAPIYYVAPTPDEAAFNRAHAGDACAEEPCGARYAVWAGAPVWAEGDAPALIFYGLIYAEPGEWNFGSVGASIATWSAFDQDPERPVLRADAAHPTLLWDADEPAPGVGVQLIDDEVWSLSCDTRGGPVACGVMRAPRADALVRERWQYWTGADWSSDPAQLAEVVEGAPIMSVAWNGFLGAYTAIYTEPLSDRVVLRTAPDVRGPWSDPTLLFVAHRSADASPYDANAHPELARDDGRFIYVTYSRDEGNFASRFALVEIELGLRR